MSLINSQERFSGHESFVCRYGWLPKLYNAVLVDSGVLKDDDKATRTLGIGRNMVRSIQFWGECMGVVLPKKGGGHEPGPLGRLLLSKNGWDPYLENPESLWLLHWWLCARGNLAAWNLVFGDGGMSRFDKRQLVDALAVRGSHLSRGLATTTVEQHASIFCHTYYQQDRSGDDTSWCPLQGLNLIRSSRGEGVVEQFQIAAQSPVGLSSRVFALALVDFLYRQPGETKSVSLQECISGALSPGVVFKLDEQLLRYFIEIIERDILSKCIRFMDTADTQSIVLDARSVPPEYLLDHNNKAEALVYA